jgi:hypothetical protein
VAKKVRHWNYRDLSFQSNFSGSHFSICAHPRGPRPDLVPAGATSGSRSAATGAARTKRVAPGGGRVARCPVNLAISLRVCNALHRVDANTVRGRDHPHARAILPAQIGENRALDVGTDLGPTELLSFAPGSPKASADTFLDHRPLELGKHSHHLKQRLSGRCRSCRALAGAETDQSAARATRTGRQPSLEGCALAYPRSTP